MKLHGTSTSPYVRKLRVLIAEKGLDVPFATHALGPGSPVRALNPLGKVPVLELDDGGVLYDSPVIAAFLDSLSQPSLIPATGAARWAVLRLEALADGLCDSTIARMFELRRPEAERSAAILAREEERLSACLAACDRELAGRTFAVDHLVPGFTLADAALAAALGYVDFRNPHPWRERFPSLAAYAARLLARPSLVATTPSV